LARAGLGEPEHSMRELERAERELARDLAPPFLPPEPPRDHEMKDETEAALHLDRDALADTADTTDLAPERRLERGIGRPHEIRAHHAGAGERLADQQAGQV